MCICAFTFLSALSFWGVPSAQALSRLVFLGSTKLSSVEQTSWSAETKPLATSRALAPHARIRAHKAHLASVKATAESLTAMGSRVAA